MKTRKNPKVWAKKVLTTTKLWEKIGYIQLVSYMTGDARPHLEFEVYKDWRNQGVMSRELPKYLKMHKKYNPQMIAVVKRDNEPSIKILEKCGFIRIKEMDDNYCYIIDLNLTPEILEKTVKKIKLAFQLERQYEK